MKVLLSALACEPGKGSEPEVGFRTMLAAAGRHDVWVLTASESISAIRNALARDPRGQRIRLEGIEFGVSAERIVHLNAIGYHLRYDAWQRAAATRALRLDKEVDFDVLHHVTLASYWTRAGVAVVPKPLVWGPIGGGVDPPIRLLGELGFRGLVESLGRVLGRPVIARLPAVRATQRTAAVILAQNPDTGRRLRVRGKIKLLSNALAIDLDGFQDPDPPRRTSEILFVGRLLPWKAPILALRAFRHVQDPSAVLRFCGDGPEQGRLERTASQWGLADRVRFDRWKPRPELLSLVRRAGALIHPALHEEAGLCIAEALALGTPVICLDHGGPAEIVGQWAGPSALIAPRSPDTTARSMAAAIDRFLRDPPTERERPIKARTSFAEELLDAYEVAAAAGTERDPSQGRAPTP
jgi:glycosyltransferase involved in cell wall biosynthesis